MGICQGLEVVSLILGEDNPSTLDEIFMYGNMEPVTWNQTSLDNSTLFGTFPPALIDHMSVDNLTLHAHSYSIDVATYNKTPGMRKEMNILHTVDYEKDGQPRKFIGAMEGKTIPVYLIMYHPEYQMLDFKGPKRWQLGKDNGVGHLTEEIAFRLSLLLNRQARLNRREDQFASHQERLSFLKRHRVSAIPSRRYDMLNGLEVFAYGYY